MTCSKVGTLFYGNFYAAELDPTLSNSNENWHSICTSCLTPTCINFASSLHCLNVHVLHLYSMVFASSQVLLALFSFKNGHRISSLHNDLSTCSAHEDVQSTDKSSLSIDSELKNVLHLAFITGWTHVSSFYHITLPDIMYSDCELNSFDNTVRVCVCVLYAQHW